MALRIEDYAVIGDLQSAALVGRDGSVDWLCLPRLDSAACFAALLGTEDNGRWRIGPADGSLARKRRYRPGTLVLETDFETETGSVRVIDFMPIRGEAPDVVRIVRGLSGTVEMRMDLTIRFDYGRSVPWVRRQDGQLLAIAGPDAAVLKSEVPVHGENFTTVADFTIGAGDEAAFVLTWYASHLDAPQAVPAREELHSTVAWWAEWGVDRVDVGEFTDIVRRSLITLKALTFAPTGGIAAAVTTSLPEQLGGVRNWDYRFCWVRDASMALTALMQAGFGDEARAWRDWLLRAAAGTPREMQIMYGLSGERRLTELELTWLPGYEDSRPVRIGNLASEQFQLDVYGELMDAMYHAREMGIEPEPAAWNLQRVLLQHLEEVWDEPDVGIWEMRGPALHLTHSKVMAWVAFDRAVRSCEHFQLDGAVDRWRALRDRIHREVCERAWDPERRTFTQSYGAKPLDAALLMIPLSGFLPADDPRVIGTVDAIQRELMRDGFLLRYETAETADGLPPGEGAFLPCSFWLVEVLAMIGREDEARRLMRRLCGLANDVGLLAEEYDVEHERQVGNFPQAFTHLALASAAYRLEGVL